MDDSIRQKLFSTLCEDAQDAILYADHEGIIRFWNRGSELIFGYLAEDAVGQSLDLIIPEHLRQRHNEGYFKVMKTGYSRYSDQLMSVPALKEDNEKIFIDFSIVILREDDGKILGIAAIMRDSTKQKGIIRELKQQIMELRQSE